MRSLTSLNNVPGLTAHRLGELWSAVQHVTQDPSALCNVTYYALGGLAIEIYWHQNGQKHHYPAVLTAEQVRAAAIAAGNDEMVWQDFATRTLEAVRAQGNRLGGAAAHAGLVEQPSFRPTAQTAAILQSIIGAARASDPPRGSTS